MITLITVAVCALLGAAFVKIGAWYGRQIGYAQGRLLEAENAKKVEFYRESGTVEVDCRACEQINRVPWQRIRDKPVCGKCKARLLPKARVRVSVSDPAWQRELDRVWNDYDKVWGVIGDAFDRLSTIKPDTTKRAEPAQMMN